MKKECDLLEFIPDKIICGENQKEYPLNIGPEEDYIMLSYLTDLTNNAKREYSLTIPRKISLSEGTFEVIGLLQAEMGKTNNGCLVFANREYQLINKVMRLFDKELELTNNAWRWYIKVNINEPEDKNYKNEIETKVINRWLNKTQIDFNMKHPKTVTYIKNTKNKRLGFYDYGTLIIEHKNNLLSQIIKRFVKIMSFRILDLEKEEIRGFMRGILAGESTVEVNKVDKKYRVHISVTKEDEKDLYWNCLKKLDIGSKKYGGDKLVISKRENNVQLLKQRLMTLSFKKYNKFLNMMKLYPGIKEETGYFSGNEIPWNKIPSPKINQILNLYNSGTIRTNDIAEEVGVSLIKVCRVLKENNLGKRIIKIPESKRKEIAQFSKENLKLTYKQIAKYFKISESVVVRACKKYGVNKGNKSKCKIPEEKIKRIIEIYKENPTVKYSEIMKEVGISDSVIKRVRKENNLQHLGYKHLIGCNNKNLN